MTTEHDLVQDARSHAAVILDYWFSTLDDAARMYGHDALALAVSITAIREYEQDEALRLIRRMFLYVISCTSRT